MKVSFVLKYLRLFLLTSLVGLAGACAPTKSEQYLKLQLLLAELGYNGKTVPTYILMTPVEGCKPCIEEALDFALKNQNKPELLIITSGMDTKAVMFRLNKAGFGTKGNLLVDTKGLSLQYDFVTTNPLLVTVDGYDVEVVKLEPSNIIEELNGLKAKL